MCRFRRVDVDALLRNLDLPDSVRAKNGVTADPKTALLMVIRRLSTPSRLSDIELQFGWERSRFSRIATSTAWTLFYRWRHLLSRFSPRLTREKLAYFAHVVSEKGAPLPNCIAFTDARRNDTFRPVRNQRIVFNGWKRSHCFAFQSTTTPDGIHIHLYGPVEGRRHDATVYKQSGLAALLDQHAFAPDGEPLVIYGDPAYALGPHLICPFKGIVLPDNQQAFNTEMSRVREAVEWGFADVTRQWAFLRSRQKILLEPIGLWYFIGTLLANARNCIYPNQISTYFDCPPPTLEEYFVGDPLPAEDGEEDVAAIIRGMERDMEVDVLDDAEADDYERED